MPGGKRGWDEPDTQLFWLEQVVNAMRRCVGQTRNFNRAKLPYGKRNPHAGADRDSLPPEVTVPDYAWTKWELVIRGAAAVMGMRVLTNHRYMDEPNSLRLVFELDS